jgi:aspartate ammonia-lyase
MTRKEMDWLGEMELPDEAYYGVETQRALLNFPVSGIRERPELIQAYVMVKKAAALANMELGQLDVAKGRAIVQAADDVLAANHMDQFPVDAFQAGAGTSVNMNVNEVLANLALEIAHRKKGDYDFINPNDHVNMAQSTNDTFPTATHIAIIMAADRLLPELDALAAAFRRKSEAFADIPKSGRTHLMDALPVRLGQEFGAYASSIERSRKRIAERRDDFRELPICGTATGTGANTHPGYKSKVLAHLSKICDIDFMPASDSFEALESRAQVAAYSSALKEFAAEMVRICNDLRLMNSGPTTGLSEIHLPPVQPGSSIMPGKVNPSMAECLEFICYQIIGNDVAVMLGAQAGQLELNIFSPLMVHNVLQSNSMLVNFLPVFIERCVDGIVADPKRAREHVDRNPILATLLNEHIGYAKAAEIAEESMATGKSVRHLAVEKGILTKAEADKLFDLMAASEARCSLERPAKRRR